MGGGGPNMDIIIDRKDSPVCWISGPVMFLIFYSFT